MAYKSISTKLIILLMFSAIIPMSIFGYLAIWEARSTTIQTAANSNINVAKSITDQIDQYIDNSLNILRSIAQNVNDVDLNSWQQKRILRNYSINFNEFNYLEIIDSHGKVISSRATKNNLNSSKNSILKNNSNGVSFSSVYITEDSTPAIQVTLPLIFLGSTNGTLIGELDLMNMWELVDQLIIGKQGHVSIISPNGQIIATSNSPYKTQAMKHVKHPYFSFLKEMVNKKNISEKTFKKWNNQDTLVITSSLGPPLNWLVSIEQPTSEAYALATSMTYQLIALICFFIFIMAIIGLISGKKHVINPIKTLMKYTKYISNGDLSKKAILNTGDEFTHLAEQFNSMSNNLLCMQTNVRKQERMAVFGRIASGLAHDLKHPIQSIKNASNLMEHMYNNNSYRSTFSRTVKREFDKIDSFLENLHNLTHDIPYHPINLNLHSTLTDVIDTFNDEINKTSIQIILNFCDKQILIHADKFSISRAFSNILSNAIQAMPNGGTLIISTNIKKDLKGKDVDITFTDSGVGIPAERIDYIFEDFTTNKGNGLGLGLALSKRILDQHGASIHVQSKINKGTKFKIKFTAT